jgi:D-alanyl-D-alanine carboxypeptidase/D-alanyl-D-alanine-endopeptidase (penicillin-binding protein 4)
MAISYCQDIKIRLSEAVRKLEADPAMKHAIMSLNVVDGKTGKTIFAENAQAGLVPASCQKVIISAAAFELLGTNYRYKTQLGYDGAIEAGVVKGNLHITGSGAPTLGSWRWDNTRENQVLQQWVGAIRKAGITKVAGVMLKDDGRWSAANIPDGWIWQDIGNYYGAGAGLVNWRENQYDISLHSGTRIGDTCSIVAIMPAPPNLHLVAEVTAAEKGTGDNAFIYLPAGAGFGYIRGTIPVGEKGFIISGSLPEPFTALAATFNEMLNASGINISQQDAGVNMSTGFKVKPLYTHISPALDSINYWFLKKSINLYGEALIKTMALEKAGLGSTEKGIGLIKDFWKQRGIEPSALNIMDGCGLSPQNRVTTDALVKVMMYAKSTPWFSSFYRSLPEINGLAMKSGSINGARSYTGYVKNKNGNEYTFAIIVNNYEGSSTTMVRKMWTILDILK